MALHCKFRTQREQISAAKCSELREQIWQLRIWSIKFGSTTWKTQTLWLIIRGSKEDMQFPVCQGRHCNLQFSFNLALQLCVWWPSWASAHTVVSWAHICWYDWRSCITYTWKGHLLYGWNIWLCTTKTFLIYLYIDQWRQKVEHQERRSPSTYHCSRFVFVSYFTSEVTKWGRQWLGWWSISKGGKSFAPASIFLLKLFSVC